MDKKWTKLEAVVIFAALVSVMAAQVVHASYVFEATSKTNNSIISVFYAVAIEFAVFIFVVHKQRVVSIIYAFAAFLTNIFYYFMPDAPYAKLLLSAMLAGTIWAFAELFSQKIHGRDYSSEGVQDSGGGTEEEKPYQCPGCGASFYKKSALNGHISAHKRVGEYKHIFKPEEYNQDELRGLQNSGEEDRT